MFPDSNPLVERVVHRSGTRELWFTRTAFEQVEGVLLDLRQAFQFSFGRPPRPEDPIFFDPASSHPEPLSHDGFLEMTAAVLAAAGIAPAIIHAVRQTGLVITHRTVEMFTPEDQERFLGYVESYLELS